MKSCGFLLAILWSIAAPAAGAADPPSTSASRLPDDYSCMFCHGDSGTLAGLEQMQHLIVTEKDLAGDIHWQKGLRCHDCHGGSPSLERYTDHRKDPAFRAIGSPGDIPGFCGRCHSDTNYMRRYRPSPRTDQEMEYWTSGHGQRLKQAVDAYQDALKKTAPGAEPPVMEDPEVATCYDCHTLGGKRHTILAVSDQKSPVYPTRVAQTCARCHSDPEHMAGRMYHGRPIGYGQYELWKQSVHGRAMLRGGDLSAPTCNDCHGNHGALPPEVGSVVNACGTCHVKIAKLFAETRMKHRFEQLELPGCATCHGNHQTQSARDAMLGMEGNAFCTRCHHNGQYGATLAGAEVARAMRAALENLKRRIAQAGQTIAEAERLGMEVRGPRFDLRQAQEALTNARSVIHTFSPEPVREVANEGLKVASEVNARAEAALAEHTKRRVWLALSLVPILLVVALLLLYIRTLPVPAAPPSQPAQRP